MVSPVADKCETPKPNSITEHTDEKPVVDEVFSYFCDMKI